MSGMNGRSLQERIMEKINMDDLMDKVIDALDVDEMADRVVEQIDLDSVAIDIADKISSSVVDELEARLVKGITEDLLYSVNANDIVDRII